MNQYVVKTRLGEFRAGFLGGKLAELELPGTWKSRAKPPLLSGQEGAAGRRLVRELRAYLAGRRTRFTVPVDPEGTAWQRRIWAAMRRIPWGEVRTYGELARMAGRPGAARAAGAACGANPILIVTPCHRVVAADGLGGFGRKARRLDLKRMLLGIERE
ncbi:MAG TPA: methylated-DNA--[protein]-cysteine S-methyltransferase [Planctomycetota bacterium]|nr:methylated-DNA--[protein]-cysteine S-methyltransferase [Planctomycetota bacterium]